MRTSTSLEDILADLGKAVALILLAAVSWAVYGLVRGVQALYRTCIIEPRARHREEDWNRPVSLDDVLDSTDD
jgi:hypothetical protein